MANKNFFVKACGFTGKVVAKVATQGTVGVIKSACPSLISNSVGYAAGRAAGIAGEKTGEFIGEALSEVAASGYKAAKDFYKSL